MSEVRPYRSNRGSKQKQPDVLPCRRDNGAQVLMQEVLSDMRHDLLLPRRLGLLPVSCTAGGFGLRVAIAPSFGDASGKTPRSAPAGASVEGSCRGAEEAV